MLVQLYVLYAGQSRSKLAQVEVAAPWLNEKVLEVDREVLTQQEQRQQN